MRKGETFTAGPFKGTVTVRQTPPFTPALQNSGTIEAALTVAGPVSGLRSIEFLDSNGSLLSGRGITPAEAPPDGAEVTVPVQFQTTPVGPVTVRFRYSDAAETIEVPFSLSAGIGLRPGMRWFMTSAKDATGPDRHRPALPMSHEPPRPSVAGNPD